MRVSCSSTLGEHDSARNVLTERIKMLGLQPVITPILIRAVYEGPDQKLGYKLVDLFEHERDHEIFIDPFSI